MLNRKLQTGGLRLDLRGHFLTFNKIEYASRAHSIDAILEIIRINESNFQIFLWR